MGEFDNFYRSFGVDVDENDKSSDKPRKIDKNIKALVWAKYNKNKMEAKCYCCKSRTIANTDFECGHVVARANGGSDEPSNLRPICRMCNSSMGKMNMNEYIAEYFPKCGKKTTKDPKPTKSKPEEKEESSYNGLGLPSEFSNMFRRK